MPALKLFRLIGSRARTANSTTAFTNEDVRQRTIEEIKRLCREFMPSGSGFDSGTTLDIDASGPTKLVFQTAYHHMNEDGFYDGWTQHKVTVLSEFDGLNIRIGGRDRNNIKEYIGETFYSALHQEIESIWDGEAREYTFKQVEAE